MHAASHTPVRRRRHAASNAQFALCTQPRASCLRMTRTQLVRLFRGTEPQLPLHARLRTGGEAGSQAEVRAQQQVLPLRHPASALCNMYSMPARLFFSLSLSSQVPVVFEAQGLQSVRLVVQDAAAMQALSNQAPTMGLRLVSREPVPLLETAQPKVGFRV